MSTAWSLRQRSMLSGCGNLGAWPKPPKAASKDWRSAAPASSIGELSSSTLRSALAGSISLKVSASFPACCRISAA
jgi:hypothetical protein